MVTVIILTFQRGKLKFGELVGSVRDHTVSGDPLCRPALIRESVHLTPLCCTKEDPMAGELES